MANEWLQFAECQRTPEKSFDLSFSVRTSKCFKTEQIFEFSVGFVSLTNIWTLSAAPLYQSEFSVVVIFGRGEKTLRMRAHQDGAVRI